MCSCDGPHFSEPESTPEASQNESPSESLSETEPEPTEPEPSETEPEKSESPTETEKESEPPAPAEPLKVMSYNVYTGSPDRGRVKKVVNNIKSFDPDIIGVQELNYSWTVILDMVTDFFDTYEMVGEPRLDPSDKSNSNEYSAIFYKKDKFDIIETDTYWLSDTPNKVSKLEGTEYYRIMTYAVVERKSDGVRFIHVNTHLATDNASRHKQIDILLALAGTVLEKHGELPIYFTGDFNMTSSDAGYKKMTDWRLDDTRYLIKPVDTNPTCGKSIIDYCFVSEGDFAVDSFKVGYVLEGSDHNLVYTELYFK
jgi:endonuclease/exonuclease/phosphatase family metal-dependent hydrolase